MSLFLRNFILSAVSVAFLTAQGDPAKANFAGRWRMERDKSQFSGFTPPDIVTRNVEQQGTVMNVHTVSTTGKQTSISDVSYALDGSPTQNVINGRDAESKTYWDGSTLVIRTSMKTAKGDDELIEDSWKLSDDKQTLTISSHIATEKGDVDMTMVCARQDAK